MDETKSKEELKIEPLDQNKIDNETDGPENKKDTNVRRKYVVNTTNTKKVVVILIVIFVFLIALVVFCLFNKLNTKVYANVYLAGYNISSMTKEKLSNYLKKQSGLLQKVTVSIMQEKEELSDILATDIDLTIDTQATLNNVMKFGRNKNIIANNIDIFVALIKGHKENIVYKYSEEKLEKITQEIRGSLENRVVDDSYVLDEKEHKLIITKGTSGNGIDADIFKQGVVSSIEQGKTEYNLVVKKQTPQTLDIDVVYSKVAREAKDAYIDETQDPVKFIPHVVGIDFDKEELRSLLEKTENKKEGAIIKFKLNVTQPKTKLSDLKWTLYEDKISSTTTYFTSSMANRASNLKLGLSILDGTIVMPGEIFSFNTTMGDCGLSSRGFKPAATFKAGKVVQEVGGGICQVASTLYNSALKANLEIVARSNHALPVGYVKPSLDATVYYPYVDFKFKNTRNYPIKIVTSYNSSGKMSITIMGTLEDTEYEVVLTSKILSSIAPKIQYVNDSTLTEGKTKVTSKGTSGYTSCSYKTLKLNGKLISKSLLSKDTYKSTTTTIAVGTKQISTPVITEPVTIPTTTESVTIPTTTEPTVDTSTEPTVTTP